MNKSSRFDITIKSNIQEYKSALNVLDLSVKLLNKQLKILELEIENLLEVINEVDNFNIEFEVENDK